ncbi:hypothetical protein [Emcibacter sp.]|uniref:hypothetical protein n=1 Tax=Emcibacter sp. TaxID=1979954 RepID=UPI002AA74544|nr:hypothetical protein [Emcibacter sp.]
MTIVWSLLLITVLGGGQLFAGQENWTEKKLGQVMVRADKAARQKNWSQAIKYGERMREGGIALYGPESAYTVTHLKTLNRYYDWAGRLEEIPDRIKKAYFLSRRLFDQTHNTVRVSRLLYYKLLISQKRYEEAVPVVREKISVFGEQEDDLFRKLHYLKQLHGLYGILDRQPEREGVLLEMLALNQRLIGTGLDNNKGIIMNLGRTYCLQGKYTEFDKLMKQYGLQYTC